MMEFKRTDKLTQAVRDHEGLVKSIANQFVGRGLQFEDLVQYGWIGFMKAYNNYDENKGAKLSSYAYPWIRGEIINALNLNKKIHIPIYRQREYRAIRKFMNGKEIDYKGIERELGFNREYVDEVINDPRIHIALDKEVGVETTLLDYMESNVKSPEDMTLDEIRERELLRIIRPVLTDRQFEIIKYAFGFTTGQPLTDKQISHILRVSPEAVRKTRVRALKRLQQDDVKEEVRKI